MIAWWLRSEDYLDSIVLVLPLGNCIVVDSAMSRVHFGFEDKPPWYRFDSGRLSLFRPWGFNSFLVVPHWVIVIVTASMMAAPWLRWRFSLRTLLIATTLVAVVLGAAVWASR
jgi:hypothetical protein